jgi:type III restriction enzyme
VIMDEPQNMESGPAKAAIESLNPMCTLRYSATHRNLHNLIYHLSPVDAYDMKLVKRIEVDSVLEEADFNQPYVSVGPITATKSKISAKLTLDVRDKSGPKRKTVTVNKNGVDLFDLSGERELYQGYIVDHIDAGNKYVAFTNGERLYEGDTIGENRDERMRVQVRETVREHLEKELRILRTLPEERRLKVLSLFFIDRVANYADADGKIKRWFVEAYEDLSKERSYAPLNPLSVEAVHNGYFAKDKAGPKDTTGKTKADDEAYEIIMKDKERLLSPEEPLRFIFSHSALREGWDNPNVFQICTLNESRTEMRKRQEIGRGLRLPVDASGERSFDPNINKLTVVANESYADFVRDLQTEIEEETGVEFKDRIVNKRQRRKANLKQNWRLDENFKELWTRIKHKTRYSVDYDTQELVSRASKAVSDMPRVSSPKIVTEKRDLEIKEEGIGTSLLSFREEAVAYGSARIPDLLGHIQRETELTRGTIVEILTRSGRLSDVRINPQQFMDGATRAIRRALDELMVDGIKYERIAEAEYEMLLFEEKEIVGYENRMLPVDKSIYDAIEYESGTEEKFARDLDSRRDIKLFLKLPSWFMVETPIGTYNPDWAIVKQPDGEEEKLYLVKETKSDLDPAKRRPDENAKIKCGEAHFDSLPDVEFQVVNDARQV